jgi:hypothetical protein
MKRLIWVFTVFVLLVANLAAVDYISIRDIQYTTNPGCEGTYPSQRLGEVVSTGGVVTAVEDGSGMLYFPRRRVGSGTPSACAQASKSASTGCALATASSLPARCRSALA